MTKTVTSAVLNALGDVLSQKFFEDSDTFDFKRTFIFAVLVGSTIHPGYLYSETYVKRLPASLY